MSMIPSDQDLVFQNFSDFLSKHLPASERYSLVAKEESVIKDLNEITTILREKQSFDSRDDLINFAAKVFGTDPLGSTPLSINTEKADSFGVSALLCSSNKCADIDKRGTLELNLESGISPMLSASTALKVKFSDKESFECTPFGETVACSATVGGRSVVPGGQWISWMPYIVGVGSLYCAGKAALGIGQLFKSVNPSLQGSEKALVKAPKDKTTDKLKSIGINLFLTAVFLVASGKIYSYDSQYHRI